MRRHDIYAHAIDCVEQLGPCLTGIGGGGAYNATHIYVPY